MAELPVPREAVRRMPPADARGPQMPIPSRDREGAVVVLPASGVALAALARSAEVRRNSPSTGERANRMPPILNRDREGAIAALARSVEVRHDG